jgi:hypothetical protein
MFPNLDKPEPKRVVNTYSKKHRSEKIRVPSHPRIQEFLFSCTIIPLVTY